MSNQEKSPSILKALADLQGGHHPLAMSILAEMEIMRQVETHLSQTTDKIDDQALHDLHKRISDDVVSAVHEVVSTGGYKETRTGPAAQGSVMLPGQVLNPGDVLRSGDSAFIYHGDLRLDKPMGSTLWFSGIYAISPEGVCVLEEDGNLVIYNPDGKPIWMTGTWGHPGSRLIVQEGYVMIERPASQPPGPIIPPIAVWSTDHLLGTVRTGHATGITAMPPVTTLTVPEGRKILCGGATLSGGGGSGFLTASFPKDARTWVAEAKVSSPASIEVFPITIYDPGDECEVRIFSEKMGGNPIAAATATVPEDYVLTGGGAQASEGSFLMASFPGAPKSWTAISKTPTPNNTASATSTASVTAYAIGIRASDRARGSIRDIFERKMFETKVFANTGPSAHDYPSAEISIPADYVLTGGGALVNVAGFGDNFLQQSLPFFPHRRQWKASSKELRSGACTITVLAIGARVGSGTLFQPPG